MDIKKQNNVGLDLSFCIEHSRNTCCDSSNTNFIRNKAGMIRVNSLDLSQTCADYTTRNFCSLCDGGISTGFLQGICPSQWNKWFEAWKEDFFTGDSRANELGAGEISFWNKNSLLWSKLKDIYQNPEDFWMQMGLDVSKEEENWYDGEPWVTKAGKGIKIKKPKSKKNKKKDVSLFGRIKKYFSDIFNQYPILFLVIYSTIFLITFTYFLKSKIKTVPSPSTDSNAIPMP